MCRTEGALSMTAFTVSEIGNDDLTADLMSTLLGLFL